MTWWTRKPGSTTSTSRTVRVVAAGVDVDLVAETRQRARELAHVDVHAPAVTGAGLGQRRRVVRQDGETSHRPQPTGDVPDSVWGRRPWRALAPQHDVGDVAAGHRDRSPANRSRPRRCRRAGPVGCPSRRRSASAASAAASRGSRTTTTSPGRTARQRRSAVSRSPGT